MLYCKQSLEEVWGGLEAGPPLPDFDQVFVIGQPARFDRENYEAMRGVDNRLLKTA
jgi:hypothetical protein